MSKVENKNLKRSRADEELLQRALNLRSEGDLDGAEVVLVELSNRCPDDLLVSIILGGVLFNLDKYLEAKLVFQRVLDVRPANEPSSLGLFHSLWHLGERHAALGEMKRFLDLAESREYEELKRGFERAITVAEEDASANTGRLHKGE